jgi:hypothetical protein
MHSIKHNLVYGAKIVRKTMDDLRHGKPMAQPKTVGNDGFISYEIGAVLHHPPALTKNLDRLW